MKSSFVIAFAVFALAACATPELVEGRNVSMNQTQVSPACTSLGEVYGKGGGAFGGTNSDEDLMRYATNEMMNNAGKLGATHVISHGPTVSGGLWHATTGTVSGTAFKCPAGAIAAATPVPPVAPAAPVPSTASAATTPTKAN